MKLYCIYKNKRAPYLLGILIAFDRFVGSLFPGAIIDETISSRIGRAEQEGRLKNKPLLRLISFLLNKIDKNHCKDSIGV
jgi:hypothetical protein